MTFLSFSLQTFKRFASYWGGNQAIDIWWVTITSENIDGSDGHQVIVLVVQMVPIMCNFKQCSELLHKSYAFSMANMEGYYGGIPEIPETFPCLPFVSFKVPSSPHPRQALECTSTFKPCLLLFLHPLDRLSIWAGPFLSPFASSELFLTSITCLGLSCVYLREWIPRHLYTRFLDFAHGWLHTVSNASKVSWARDDAFTFKVTGGCG